MSAEQRHLRRSEKKGMKARDTQNSIPIEGLKQLGVLTDLQIQLFKNIAESSFYYYTSEKTTIDCFTVLGFDRDHIKSQGMKPEDFKWHDAYRFFLPLLYGHTQNSQDEFYDAHRDLWEDKNEVIKNGKVTQSLLPETSKTILDCGYDLVSSFNKINDARINTKLGSQLRANQRLTIKHAVSQISPDKTEAFRETMRRYIPRWMHHPLEYPEGIESDETTKQLWSGYTNRDANLLINPDQLAEGKAPFHMAMKAANALEREGKADLAYTLRTDIIKQTLTMEQDKYTQEENPEFPFFRLVLGGVMTGDVGKPPKRAHFDYQDSLQQTLRQTFTRLEEELQTNQPGKATEFINHLHLSYQDDLPSLLGRALMHYSDTSKFDPINIAQQLSQQNFPWGKNILDTMVELPSRRALNGTEIEEMAAFLPQPPAQHTLEDFYTNLDTVMGEEDIYDFKFKFRDENTKGQVSLNVELDRLSEEMEVMLRLDNNGTTRFVPFTLSFSGESESFQIPHITEQIPHEVIEKYSGVVLTAIKKESDKTRERASKKMKQFNASTSIISENNEGQGLRLLTRADRLALYEKNKDKKEKRGKLKSSSQVETTVFPSPDIMPPQQEEKKKEIVNLDLKTVEELLKAQRIDVISSDEVITTLTKLLDKSSTHNTMLGTRPYLYGIKELDRESHLHKKLRKIRWVSGSNAIRVFMEDLDHGKFALRGILLKKGPNQQREYIKKLVLQLQRDANHSQ